MLGCVEGYKKSSDLEILEWLMGVRKLTVSEGMGCFKGLVELQGLVELVGFVKGRRLKGLGSLQELVEFVGFLEIGQLGRIGGNGGVRMLG